MKNHPLYEEFRLVFLFIVLTLAIHFAFRFWAIVLNYAPLSVFMSDLGDQMVTQQYMITFWSLDHIFHIPYAIQGSVIWFSNHHGFYINENCSGMKQIAQFVVLMLFFRGPWIHRLWHIPLGVIAVYMTAVIRVVLLAVTESTIPHYYYFFHDFLLRVLFYIVIFLFWLFWIRKFTLKILKADVQPQP
ncbi:MAG: hypothetical protein Q8867_07890 [Bacteroidota bacterium]|nr:hypothetical protein [Bacteroidota bacterium]